MNKLPIETVPDSEPQKFRWTQTVDSLIGISTVKHEGTVPLPLEDSLIALIELAQESRSLVTKLTAKLAEAYTVIAELKKAETQRVADARPKKP